MARASSQPLDLIKFFDPQVKEPDWSGRTLEDILAFNDQRLESSHDYVQILFPLPEGSAFNYRSPTVTKDVFEAFRSRKDLRTSLERGFERMMSFYGFDSTITDHEHVSLKQGENYKKGFSHWVCRMDHNHLRISRIIRSLRVLSLTAHAAAFHAALKEVDRKLPNRISSRSLMYWDRAATRPLYLAPDEADDNAVSGCQFLIDFEKAKKDESNT